MVRAINKILVLTMSIFLIILSSCNGQVDSRSKIKSKEPLAAKTNKTEKFKDPLFFIEGQLCQHLRKIYQDQKGNLWFGTNVYDLMMYNGDSLKYITQKEGFSGGRVTGISEDKTGNIWIATGNGLNKYDGQSFTIYTDKHGLANSEIWSMYIDDKGNIWIGHNDGLSRFDGEVFENRTIPKPQVEEPNIIYSADRITGIVEDNEGNLWLGTDGYGVCRYDGETFKHFTKEDGLCDNTIYELMSDRKGGIWIGTYHGGVSRYNGETFTNYTRDGVIKGDEAGAFFEDNNGDIWFGVENNGVYKYDGKHFSHYYKEEGLDAIVLSIYRDKESRFWFGGWGGLFRYNDHNFTPITKGGPWK